MIYEKEYDTMSESVKKLRLKDKMISDSRDSARNNKHNLHEYIKRAMSMTA